MLTYFQAALYCALLALSAALLGFIIGLSKGTTGAQVCPVPYELIIKSAPSVNLSLNTLKFAELCGFSVGTPVPGPLATP